MKAAVFTVFASKHMITPKRKPLSIPAGYLRSHEGVEDLRAQASAPPAPPTPLLPKLAPASQRAPEPVPAPHGFASLLASLLPAEVPAAAAPPAQPPPEPPTKPRCQGPLPRLARRT